jgi:hypothetical protein
MNTNTGAGIPAPVFCFGAASSASIRDRFADEPNAALCRRVVAAVTIDKAGLTGCTTQAGADTATVATALRRGGAGVLELPAVRRRRTNVATACFTRIADHPATAICLANVTAALGQPRAAGRAGRRTTPLWNAAHARVAHFVTCAGGARPACRATGRCVIDVADVGIAAARGTARAVADALAVDTAQAISTRFPSSHRIGDALARGGIAGLADWAGATITWAAIDRLPAVVDNLSARVGAGLSYWLRTARLAPATPAPSLAVLVPLLAPLAPPATRLRLVRVQDAQQPAQDWQRRQPREDVAAGIPGSQGASQGIEVAVVHGGLSVLAYGKAGGQPCAREISLCDAM